MEWLGLKLDYPMFIVTAASGSARAGCLIGFGTQCSVDPIRFVVYLSKKNRTYRIAEDAPYIGVHVVPADRLDLAELFGGETGDDIDKFERCSWRPGPGGVPIVDDCKSWFVGRVVGRSDGGDHGGLILEPVEGEALGGPALGFQDARHIDPGHPA